jgi:hypothetical protein
MNFLCHLLSGEVNATRYVDLAILEYLVPNYVTIVLTKPDYRCNLIGNKTINTSLPRQREDIYQGAVTHLHVPV